MFRAGVWLRHRLADRRQLQTDLTGSLGRVYQRNVPNEFRTRQVAVSAPATSSSSTILVAPLSAETAAPPPPMRLRLSGGITLSGVQLEALRLYRQLLKGARQQEDEGTRVALAAHIRGEFESARGISRRDVDRIEWKLRTGYKKLDQLRAAGRKLRFATVTVPPPPS